MELIISAIVAPLWIAAIAWAFKRRSIVWFYDATSLIALPETSGKYFQCVVIWNAGGQFERNLCMDLSSIEGAQLTAASRQVEVTNKLVKFDSIRPNEKVSLLIAIPKRISQDTSIEIVSSHSTAQHIKKEADAVSSRGLGTFLTCALLVVGLAFGMFYSTTAPTEPSVKTDNETPVSSSSGPSKLLALTTKEASRPGWTTVGDIDRGDIAKYYPAPTYPLVVAAPVRKNGYMAVNVLASNTTDQPIAIQLSLGGSYPGDPVTGQHSNFINDVVVPPGTQRGFELWTWAPGKYAGELVVLQTWVSYRDQLIAGRKYLPVPK